MSVDNEAILFVGLPPEDVDPRLLPGIDLELWEHSPGQALDRNHENNPKSLGYYDTNDYQTPSLIIGYLIGYSGSYGIKELPDCVSDIQKAIANFKEVFQKEPKVYLFNHQS